MFRGDRCANVKDPLGYQRALATHQKDLSDEEVKRGGEAFARQMAPPSAQR